MSPPLLLCAVADIIVFNIAHNNLFNVPDGDSHQVWADNGYWLKGL